MPTGLAPAVTFFMPSLAIAWVKTVAVVVPSPATSLVLLATSSTNCAPMFSKRSSNSISRAMVTPSLVIKGEPKVLSKTTLRPLGPKVVLTVFAKISTPRKRAARASSENFNSFAIKSHSFSILCLVLSLKLPRHGLIQLLNILGRLA